MIGHTVLALLLLGWHHAMAGLAVLPFLPFVGMASNAPLSATRPNLAAPQGGRLPFRQGTDWRESDVVDTRTWAAGTTLSPIFLPQIGFLDSILVVLRGTMTLIGAQSYADLGPHSITNRVQVKANVAGVITDLSGYGLWVIQRGIEYGWSPDRSGLANLYAAPTAGGADVWNLLYVIPVAANMYDNMDLGPLLLQSDQIRVSVNLTCGQNLDAVVALGGGAGFAGTYTIFYTYWEVPDPNLVTYPLPYVHRFLEDSTAINSVGAETRYLVPRQGTALRLWHVSRLNGARDMADVTQFRLIYNKSLFPRVRYPYEEQYWQFRQLGIDQPTGVWLWNLWHSEGLVGNGDFRDAIDTDPIATLESGLTFASGAVLGSGNNEMRTIREFVEVLQT